MNKINNKLFCYADTADPLGNVICSSSSRNNINMCSNPILNFLQNNISLGLWNTSRVDDGDEYAPNFQDLAKNSWWHIWIISNI